MMHAYLKMWSACEDKQLYPLDVAVQEMHHHHHQFCIILLSC